MIYMKGSMIHGDVSTSNVEKTLVQWIMKMMVKRLL